MTFGTYAAAWLRRPQPQAADPARTTGACSTGSSSRRSATCRSRHITPESVRRWHADLGTTTPTLRAHAYGLLRTILGAAVRTADPRQPLPHPRRRQRQARPQDQARHPAPSSRPSSPRCPSATGLMVLLASWCAMRFGELAELRRGDIDIKARRHPRPPRGRPRRTGESIVGTPEDRRRHPRRRDPAAPDADRPRAPASSTPSRGKDGLLFPARRRQPPGPLDALQGLLPGPEAAGRPDLRWHDLRHTGAVLAASDRAPRWPS